MKTKLLALIFLLTLSLFSQTKIPIADKNFQLALIDLGWDTNGLSGDILQTDIVKIDSLKIWNPTNVVRDSVPLNPYLSNVKGAIKDISPIKFMPKLTYLYAGYNRIDKIDVSQNPILTYLDLRVNNLSEIDVSKNRFLLLLNVAFNNISTLDVTKNYNLLGLAIFSNKIRDIDVRSNGLLKQLSVGKNPMPFINLKNNGNLQDLEISATLIKDLDLSTNTLLRRFRCFGTPIEELNLEANPLLTRFEFGGNTKVEEINLLKQTSLDTLNISQNINLSALNLKNGSNSKILSFTSVQNPKLSCINVDNVNYSTTNWIFRDPTVTFDTNCYGNTPPTVSNLSFSSEITSELSCVDPYIRSNSIQYEFSDEDDDKEKNSIITWFTYDANKSNKRELTSAKNKTSINISFPGRGDYYFSFEVTPSDGTDNGEKVESAIFGPYKDYNQFIDRDECEEDEIEIVQLFDLNFEQALIDLGYDSKLDNKVYKDSISTITKLDLNNKNISNLSGISAFSKLDTLMCSNNNLTELFVYENYSLKSLSASNNAIENISVNSNIESISISNNKIKVIDASELKKLEYFDASNNELQALIFNNENNTNITFFDITNNPNLQCVQVDDVNYAVANWTNIDNNTLYSENCSANLPVAKNLRIEGELTQYETLTVAYDYEDEQNFLEYGTIVEWYIADDEFGRNIESLSLRVRDYRSRTQRFTYHDIGKYVGFKVKPKNGFVFGEETEIAFFGPIIASTTVTNRPPEATNLDPYGQLYAGKTISALYDYRDENDDAENGTLYSWYLSDDALGTNKEIIAGVNEDRYLLKTNDAGKYISFEVTPYDGQDYGLRVESNLRGPIQLANNPPTATNVTISGGLEIGDTLTATYDYSDIEGDVEIASFYQWYISDDALGNNQKEISGANELTFTTTQAQENKYISFKVSPYDGVGFGNKEESQLIGPIGNSYPVVNNVIITGVLKEGEVLTASYDYSDFDNEPENGSVYKWYISDDAEGKNKTKVIGAVSLTFTLAKEHIDKYISFEVTPNDGSDFGPALESPLLGPIEPILPVVKILDENFEKALIDLGYDTNGFTGNILVTDALAITSLNISNPTNNSNLPNVNNKIKDLTGIENLVNLEFLSCSSNAISNLDLSKNTKLRSFVGKNNMLLSLNLANGNNLNFTGINTENNPNLTCIQVDNKQYSIDNWIFTDEQTGFSEDCFKGDAISNYYTTVPDSEFEEFLIAGKIDTIQDGKFRTIDAYYIQSFNFGTPRRYNYKNLKGIEAFKNLKVFENGSVFLEKANFSQNLNLVKLSLGSAKLDSLDVSKLTKLEELRCIGSETANLNNLKYLNINGAVNLKILEVQENKLENLDVSTNTKLTWLNVGNNKLTKLDVTNNTVLETFGCYQNDLKFLDASKSPNLKLLYCHKNNLEYLNINKGNNLWQDFNATDNPNLLCIQVFDKQWADNSLASKVDNTASFSEDCNSVWEVYTEDESLNTALNSVTDLDTNNDGKITYEEAQAYTGDLDLSNKNINDISGLEAFSNASSINVSGNNITDISNLFDNSVTVISKSTGKKRTIFKNNTIGMKKLDASNNLIEEVDISKVTTLSCIF